LWRLEWALKVLLLLFLKSCYVLVVLHHFSYLDQLKVVNRSRKGEDKVGGLVGERTSSHHS